MGCDQNGESPRRQDSIRKDPIANWAREKQQERWHPPVYTAGANRKTQLVLCQRLEPSQSYHRDLHNGYDVGGAV
eukprot:11593048-Heterocapsa_arctica.AAC.1